MILKKKLRQKHLSADGSQQAKWAIGTGQGTVFLVMDVALVTHLSPTKLYLLSTLQHLNSDTGQSQIFYTFCLEEFLSLNDKIC